MTPRTLAICCFASVLFGVPLSNAQPVNCGDPPDVLIVLDKSSSMTESAGSDSKWYVATNAVNELVQKFSLEIRFGLMLFPGKSSSTLCAPGTIEVKIGDNTQGDIQTALKIYPSGLTPLEDSLENALTYLQSIDPNKKKYVLLITDGSETCSGKPVDATKALFAANIKTFVVGFGNGVNPKELNAMADAGGTALQQSTKYYQADNANQLNQALKAIGDMVSCCGNGVMDPFEKCDKAIPHGLAGACPTQAADCDDQNPCTNDSFSGQECNVTCKHNPIIFPKHGDGCCPVMANSLNDNDCPVACGNGLLEAGEACDPKIKSGPGKCKTLEECRDNDPCTVESLAGSACNVVCHFEPTPANLAEKDGCCPKGLSNKKDADCPPECDPDSQGPCVNPCKEVDCPDGQYCDHGQCKPWPEAKPENQGLDNGLLSLDGAAITVGGSDGGAGNGSGFYADSGCNCKVARTSDAFPWILCLALFALLRRRH